MQYPLKGHYCRAQTNIGTRLLWNKKLHYNLWFGHVSRYFEFEQFKSGFSKELKHKSILSIFLGYLKSSTKWCKHPKANCIRKSNDILHWTKRFSSKLFKIIYVLQVIYIHSYLNSTVLLCFDDGKIVGETLQLEEDVGMYCLNIRRDGTLSTKIVGKEPK